MEKFTNIAGGAFLPYVAKQIENRKKFIQEYNDKRENKHLEYFNNRNAWIRLTSCVDITTDHKLFKKYNLSGPELAKKYVLQGGVVNNQQNQITNRSGFGNDGLYNLLPNKPLGFKPIPGITSIDLSSSGKLGTLQYATIKFICYDIEQLELMDALYMKLGFSLVLEWGHTSFLDENGNYTQNVIPLDIFNYTDKDNLLKAIQDKRVTHSANYDGMLGTVSNFGWEIQSDGSYLCDIKLVGAGDILESLKINQAVNQNTDFGIKITDQDTDEEKESKILSQIADKDLSVLNQALFSIYQQILKSEPNDIGIRLTGVGNKNYRNTLNKIFSSCPYNFINIGDNGYINGDDKAKRGNHYSLISEINKNNGGPKIEIPIISNTLFNSISIPYNITDINGNSSTEDQVYITLGNLLAIITATGMLYNTKNQKDGKPHIYIDFNDKLNYCSTFEGQMSLDPTICVIPRNQSNLSNPFNLEVVEDVIFNNINNTTVDKRETNIWYSDGSYEPGYVIEGETTSLILRNNYLNLPTEDKKVRARLMHLLVNINYITDTIKQIRDNNNKGIVNASEFLNKLLEGISKALCGFNEFRISVDNSNKCIRIIDDNKTTSTKDFDNDNQYTEIPVLGKNSIVYNYSFKSKIGPNMASMVTIAAQANPSALGDDAFAISNLSRGLLDRIAEEKTPSNYINQTIPNTTKISEDNLKTLKQHISSILGDGTFNINYSSIEPSINTYKELLADYRTKQDIQNRASVIIPLDFNLEMDGLSGIIPQSAFIIPPSLLPSSYLTLDNKPKIAFIIHTISQNFTNNKWTTKISGQTINIRFDLKDNIITPKLLSSNLNNDNPNFNNNSLENIYFDSIDYKTPIKSPITTPSLSKLKDIIGYHESKNNYGIANIGGSSIKSRINVNGLTFETLKTQQQLPQGNPERVFAAGRFQIIPSTMNNIIRELNFKSNDRFNPLNQEKMGDWLLLENRRLLGNYIKGINKGSSVDLANAINQIGYEWASMPVINKTNGDIVGDVIKGLGNTANYGGKGSNPAIAKTNIKTIVNALIRARIEYSSKSPIFIPNYYNPLM